MGGLPDGWHLKTGEPVKDGDLVLRWQPRIYNNMSPLEPDILADSEILKDSGHHLTRGTHAVSNILLC